MTQPSTQQQQQQQQQKQPEQRESQTPLQILPAMLHAVFCQTADVFNAPHRQQPRAVIYTNAQIRTSVSVCNERFQYALDLLEMDILKAKATFRHDLSHLRTLAAEAAAARLAEEEAAAARERARLEAEARAIRQREEEAAAAKAEAERLKREAAEKEEAELQRRQLQDTVMADVGGGEKQSDGYDFLFDDGQTEGTAPPAPMVPGEVQPAAAGNFDDFLAAFVGPGTHEGVDGGMGGGQPLEGGDLFNEEFHDLFYGGT